MIKKNLSIGLALAVLLSVAALAGPAPSPPPMGVQSTAPTPLAVGTSNQRVVLAYSVTSYPVLALENDGTIEAFCTIGNSGVTATTSSINIQPGQVKALWLNGATYYACITASSTTTIKGLQYTGAPTLTGAAGAGGGGGGGNVTIIGPLGQAVMTGSVPVVIASNQSSIPATVTNSGTFATQATLQAGSAIAGKFGIDQTTPGTTNGVQTLSGSTTAVTGNVTVIGTGTLSVQNTAATPAGTNVIGHVIVDTAPSTAVTNAGTFAVQAAQSGNWSARIVGNAGGIFDAVGQNAASPANELLVGGQYNSAPTTITTGNMSPFQLDANGNLKVNIQSGGGSGGTSSNFAATFPAIGTAIGAKNGANMVNLTADGSNNLNVNCAVGCSGGSVSNASSAVATSSTNLGTVAWNYGFNGTTWDQLQVDGSKNLKTVVSAALPAGTNVIGHVIADTGSTTAVTGNVTVVQPTGTSLHAVLDTTSTTAVTQATGTNLHTVVDSGTITAVTSLTNALPAGTNLIGVVGNAQGSTTSGQSGPLVQGAVTTGAPTYTTGQTSPLSLDTAGNLRVNVVSGGGGGTSSAFAAAFPANGTAIGAKNGSNMVNLTADASNNLNVNVQSSTGTAAGTAIGSVTFAPIAARASSTNPTAATDGNVVSLQADLGGQLVTMPYANKGVMLRGANSTTAGTATTLTGMGAQGAGVKIYITGAQCFRTDAGTTTAYVTLNDSASTTIVLPAGGGSNPTFNVPLSVAANTAATFTASTALTTVFCNAQGFAGP